MLKLQGILAPLTTPFDHTGEIYKTKVRYNVEKWNLVKLAGYVVCGATGEGVHLSADEKVMLWGQVAEAAASGRLLLAGVGAEGVRETVALTNKAAELGYQAAVIGTPHYYRHLVNNAEAQELYFCSVADRAKIPVVIENIPQLTGIDLPAESVAKLSEHPNIIGIKESSGVIGKINWMLREVRKGFQILAGSEPAVWQSLDLGATGAIVDFANAAPYACITIWEAHRTREREAAQDWQNRITRPAALVTMRYGLPGLKHAMDLNGYYGGPCRLPLPPLTPEAKDEISQAFDGIRG
jgi:4-hydroxy-2-oxoglutarate aldolase